MTPDQAREIIQASNDFVEKFHNGERTLNAERNRIKARLAHLQEEMPELLAAEVLGEIQNGKVREARDEIAAIENRLAEIPVIFRGLRAREHKYNVAHARALNALRHHKVEKERAF